MNSEKQTPCCNVNLSKFQHLENPDISDEDAISIFKQLAHPLRLKILRILLFQPELCTCELTELFSESQPIISRQLSILEKGEILKCRTLTMEGIAGRWHAYQINPTKKALISQLLLPFTQNNEDVVKNIK